MSVWSATTGVDGPHIVLVHGSLDRSAGLLKLSRRLDDRYRVTRYDRRGYGRSRTSDGPFGIAAQVTDMLHVIEHASADARPRIIVGHSYGGNVALAFADQYADMIDGVVTYETPLSWHDWWPGDSAGADAVAWRADPEEAAERFMRRLIGDDRWERLPPTTRSSRRAEGTAMVGELLDLRERAPWQPGRIRAPVMAMHGEFGQPHHRRGADVIAASVADGRMVTLAGAKHPGPNTHPDLMADAVDEFIRRRVAPTSARSS